MNLAGSLGTAAGAGSLAPGKPCSRGGLRLRPAGDQRDARSPAGITFEALGRHLRAPRPSAAHRPQQRLPGTRRRLLRLRPPTSASTPPPGRWSSALVLQRDREVGCLCAGGRSPPRGADPAPHRNMARDRHRAATPSQQLARTPLGRAEAGGRDLPPPTPAATPPRRGVLLWRVWRGQLDHDRHETPRGRRPGRGRRGARRGDFWVPSGHQSRGPGGSRVYARRSNPTVTSWEPAFLRQATPSRDRIRLNRLAARPRQGDRVRPCSAHFGIRPAGFATWHTQLAPPVAGGDLHRSDEDDQDRRVDDQADQLHLSQGVAWSAGQNIALAVTSKPYRVFGATPPPRDLQVRSSSLIDKKVKADAQGARPICRDTVSTKGLKVGPALCVGANGDEPPFSERPANVKLRRR